MKKTRRIIVLLLTFAMLLSITACAKKPIDYKEFRDILEDDFDFEIEKGSASKDVDKMYYGQDEDEDYHAQYTLYEDADDAEDEMEDQIDDIEDLLDDDEFDGKIKKSGSGKYQKVIIEGEYEEYDMDVYMVVIRSDAMILSVSTFSTRDKHIDAVNDIVKALGY